MSAVRVNGSKPGVASALESWPLLPVPAHLVHDGMPVPLNHSTRLARVSTLGVELSRLYAREAFECDVAGRHWRLQWRYFEGPLTGLEVQLRIGGTDVLVVIEEPGVLGVMDIDRPELPDELRTAYLAALADPVWSLVESALGRAIEVVAVRADCTMNITSDCVSFEVGVAPNGPATRGFLGPLDSRLQQLLCQLGRPVRRNLLSLDPPFDWIAVIGTTQLFASQLRALDVFDVVLIDDAVFNNEALECQLVIGADRRRVGRAVLQLGELRMVQLNSPGTAFMGAAFMTNREMESAGAHEGAFDDVPVVLRFELAHWQAPLSEMAQLAPGAVIDLGHRIDSQSVAVWVGQRCIGRGQLVALGERLGVRILSLVGQERSTPMTNERQMSADAVPGS